jgi:hypothetical protein
MLPWYVFHSCKISDDVRGTVEKRGDDDDPEKDQEGEVLDKPSELEHGRERKRSDDKVILVENTPFFTAAHAEPPLEKEIGRASCRERVFRAV